jgi:hypothetical protein
MVLEASSSFVAINCSSPELRDHLETLAAQPPGSTIRSDIPATVVGFFAVESLLRQLCKGVLILGGEAVVGKSSVPAVTAKTAQPKDGYHAEQEPVKMLRLSTDELVELFLSLTPEQRRDPELDVAHVLAAGALHAPTMSCCSPTECVCVGLARRLCQGDH